MRPELLLATFAIVFASFSLSAYLMSSVKRRKPDSQLEAILSRLPSWDCGLCGEENCMAFANKLASSLPEGRCVPGGTLVEHRLTTLLGRSPYGVKTGKAVAVVACAGNAASVKPSFFYAGYRDCAAAARLYGGPRACGSGCLGYGSCIPACDLRAISVEDGLASIDPDICDGCGNCVSACPTGVIRLLPNRDSWYVACSSTAPGKVKEESCTGACTACGACERRSAGSEFTLRNNLAVPSASKTGNWASIAEDCPTGVIRCPNLEKRKTRPYGNKNAGL